MKWHRIVLALLAAMSIAILGAACGGGEDTPPGAPSGTAAAVSTVTPSEGGTPVPEVTGTPTEPAETSTPVTPTETGTPTGPGGPSAGLVVGLDMDPFGTPANSCPGNDSEDCTLGTIERCKSVPNAPGETFTVDVFVQGLPQGFQAWSYNLEFPDSTSPAQLTMIDQATTDPTVNLLVQSPESEPVEVSEDVPDVATPHYAGVGEFATSEDTPPFTGGVLGRYEFAVGEGAVSGLYDVELEPVILVTVLDKSGAQYTIDSIDNGILALGQECP